jgi:hypothetical protein
VRQPSKNSRNNEGFRVLEAASRSRQAMGIPQGRDAGRRYVSEFLDEMKTNGFIAGRSSEAGRWGRWSGLKT